MRHFGDVARRLWGPRSWPNSLQHNSDSDGRRDDFEGFLPHQVSPLQRCMCTRVRRGRVKTCVVVFGSNCAGGNKDSADTLSTSAVTDLSQLESHLWEAANILRGPVDAADFKTYVFPLLFFKRLSDVHDEEYQAALAEGDGDEEYALFPQNYRFQVPEGCHWRDVRAVTTNVGQALQKALRGIATTRIDMSYE